MAWYRCTGGNGGSSGGGDYKSIWDGALISDIYINYGTGQEVSYQGWSATDYLDLSDNSDGYFYRAGAWRAATYGSFYDSAKNFLSACPAADNYGKTQIPANAKYVRVSDANANCIGVIFVKV